MDLAGAGGGFCYKVGGLRSARCMRFLFWFQTAQVLMLDDKRQAGFVGLLQDDDGLQIGSNLSRPGRGFLPLQFGGKYLCGGIEIDVDEDCAARLRG